MMEKKINGRKLKVEHFLNKRLKGDTDDSGMKMYPMYVKVVYAQSTMLIRSKLMQGHYYDNETEIIRLVNEYGKKEIEIIDDILQELDDKFEKEIFYLRFELRTHKIVAAFREHIAVLASEITTTRHLIAIKEELEILIKLTAFMEQHIPADLLIDGDVLLYDWEKTHKESYKEHLQAQYSESKIKQMLDEIYTITIAYPSILK